MNRPYYLSYEERYQEVYAAGFERWGHAPDDKVLVLTLTEWVKKNDLVGKHIVEYGCGESASGVILSNLGCFYHGIDIAPTAVEKARDALRAFPSARVTCLDMVKEQVPGLYDAALDCMGFHMLVTDPDRRAYLAHAYAALKHGAPMLFFRQNYRKDAYSGEVESYEAWEEISGSDYKTPSLRRDATGREVFIPLVPARAKNERDYRAEMQEAGFVVEDFLEMPTSEAILCAASIYVRKP